MIKYIAIVGFVAFTTTSAFAQFGPTYDYRPDTFGSSTGSSSYAQSPKKFNRSRDTVYRNGKVIGRDPDVNVRRQLRRTNSEGNLEH